MFNFLGHLKCKVFGHNHLPISSHGFRWDPTGWKLFKYPVIIHKMVCKCGHEKNKVVKVVSPPVHSNCRCVLEPIEKAYTKGTMPKMLPGLGID